MISKKKKTRKGKEEVLIYRQTFPTLVPLPPKSANRHKPVSLNPFSARIASARTSLTSQSPSIFTAILLERYAHQHMRVLSAALARVARLKTARQPSHKRRIKVLVPQYTTWEL